MEAQERMNAAEMHLQEVCTRNMSTSVRSAGMQARTLLEQPSYMRLRDVSARPVAIHMRACVHNREPALARALTYRDTKGDTDSFHAYAYTLIPMIILQAQQELQHYQMKLQMVQQVLGALEDEGYRTAVSYLHKDCSLVVCPSAFTCFLWSILGDALLRDASCRALCVSLFEIVRNLKLPIQT
jgi:hypothetical protein